MRSGGNSFASGAKGTFRYSGERVYNGSASTLEESSSSTHIYNLKIVSDTVEPFYNSAARRDAFPLRCLSTTAVGYVRSGRVGTDNSINKIRYSSERGGYRGNTAGTGTSSYSRARYFSFSDSVTPATTSNNGFWGFPLRCLSATAVERGEDGLANSNYLYTYG